MFIFIRHYSTFIDFVSALSLLILFLSSCVVCTKYLPTKTKGSKKLEISETVDPATAFMIYNEYGVEDKNHICKSVDNKTSRIYGYSICKQAIEQLYPKFSYSVEASCVRMTFNKSVYKHARFQYHKMVKCVYGVKPKNCIYILNATKNYYYVFSSQHKVLSPKIIACLNIEIKERDFPEIQIQETTNLQLADDIFRYHGSLATSDPLHVCAKSADNSKTLVGQEVCKKLFETNYMKESHKNFMDKVPVKCIESKLRSKNSGLSTGRPKQSAPVLMARCWYSDDDTPKELMIWNTPLKNFYYIGKKYYKGNLRVEGCLQIPE